MDFVRRSAAPAVSSFWAFCQLSRTCFGVMSDSLCRFNKNFRFPSSCSAKLVWDASYTNSQSHPSFHIPYATPLFTLLHTDLPTFLFTLKHRPPSHRIGPMRSGGPPRSPCIYKYYFTLIYIYIIHISSHYWTLSSSSTGPHLHYD